MIVATHTKFLQQCITFQIIPMKLYSRTQLFPGFCQGPPAKVDHLNLIVKFNSVSFVFVMKNQIFCYGQ